jgi:hypothetical protein
VRAVCAAASGLRGRAIRLAHLSLSLPALYSRDEDDMDALHFLFSSMDVAALELVGKPSGALRNGQPLRPHDTTGRLASVFARLTGLRELDARGIGSLVFPVRVSRRALAPRARQYAAANSPLLTRGTPHLPPRPHIQEYISDFHGALALHTQLRSLQQLESLRVCCFFGNSGLHQSLVAPNGLQGLASSVAALTRLTSLDLVLQYDGWFDPSASDLAFIAGLPRLRSLSVPLSEPPAWLPRLSALTFLELSRPYELLPSSIGPLASLPSLRALRFGHWSSGGRGGGAGGGGGACCPGVTKLTCSVELPEFIPSLQLALPGVLDVELSSRVGWPTGGALSAFTSAGALSPRWRDVRRLSLSGIPAGVDQEGLQLIQRLGALDGGLLALSLSCGLGGAQLAELLAAAPRLEALAFADTVSDWSGCGRHESLRALVLSGHPNGAGAPLGAPPNTTLERPDLLQLCAALPSLQLLCLQNGMSAQALEAELGVKELDAAREATRRAPELSVEAASALSHGLLPDDDYSRVSSRTYARAIQRTLELRRPDALEAAAADMRAEEAARLYQMAEDGRIGWREMEARVEELLLLAPP